MNVTVPLLLKDSFKWLKEDFYQNFCSIEERWIAAHFEILILLTVHHIMILLKWPTWRTILFYVFICIFNSPQVSSTSCSSSGGTNCVNTTSGSCRWPCRVLVGSSLPTCTLHGHRHRVTATRVRIDTICLSWWWARCARNMQRVKIKNKYIEKNCASRWSFTKNHYMMHGQQNIKFYKICVLHQVTWRAAQQAGFVLTHSLPAI